MQVTIPKSKLEAAGACKVYLKSPEWDGEALVYADWAKTTDRLLSTPSGMAYLGFLVANGLVPMNADELAAAKAAVRKARTGDPK